MKISSKPKQGLIYLVQLTLHVLFFSFTTNGANGTSSNLSQLSFITHRFTPQCFVSNYYSKFIWWLKFQFGASWVRHIRTWIWCVSRSCDQIILFRTKWCPRLPSKTYPTLNEPHNDIHEILMDINIVALFSLPCFYHLRSCD